MDRKHCLWQVRPIMAKTSCKRQAHVYPPSRAPSNHCKQHNNAVLESHVDTNNNSMHWFEAAAFTFTISMLKSIAITTPIKVLLPSQKQQRYKNTHYQPPSHSAHSKASSRTHLVSIKDITYHHSSQGQPSNTSF